MNQNTGEADTEIMNRLRKPIDELVDKYCYNQPTINRVRLRQLAWQAVDILANTEDISHLKNNENIKRIIRNIKQIGAPEKFIDESLSLAVNIYQTMKTDYPTLYKSYKR